MDRLKLLNFIRAKFDDNELHDLCFALNIDYDSLSGDNKAAKARELVAHCERRERLAELTQAAQRLATAGHSPTARPGGSAFNQSGQVVLGDQINVAGDYIDRSTHGDSQRRSPAPRAVPQDDQASLARLLAEARANLRLLEERMAGFVLSTDVPLQWIKEQRQLEAKIAELEKQLGRR